MGCDYIPFQPVMWVTEKVVIPATDGSQHESSGGRIALLPLRSAR
jgi:hypothetical protein